MFLKAKHTLYLHGFWNVKKTWKARNTVYSGVLAAVEIVLRNLLYQKRNCRDQTQEQPGIYIPSPPLPLALVAPAPLASATFGPRSFLPVTVPNPCKLQHFSTF